MYSSNDLVIYLVSIETSTRHQKEKVQQEVTVLLKNLLVCASSIALIGDLKPQTCMCVSGRHRENCETPALSERRPHNRTESLCDCESETET